MTKVIEDSRPGSDVNQPMRVLCSGKPYIYFDNHAKILDCNEAVLGLTNISKDNLLGTDLTRSDVNRQFVDAVIKASAEGMSIFRGNVLLGPKPSEYYLETVFFSIESSNRQDKGIICYLLDILAIDTIFQNAIHGKVSPVNGLPELINVSVSYHALDGSVIYVSPAIELLLGYTAEELKDLSPLFAVYPDDLPIVTDVIEKLRDGNDFMRSCYRMVHKNGAIIDIETSSYLITNESGARNIVSVSWDRGAQAKIKRELELSEQKYYSLVMNLPAGVSLISNKGKLLEANNAMKIVMGIPIGKPMPELNIFNQDFMKDSGIGEQLKASIQTKEIVSGELPFRSLRTGKEVFLIYSFLPILNSDGSVETVIGYVNDLSQQKKVESESRERAEFLNLVINAIKSPFFVKDEEHKWVILNDAAVEMMGHSREELLGKSDYDLYPKVQADVFWKYDELVFMEGNSKNEEQITWSDGTLHTIVTHKQLYVEKPSGKKFIVGTIHDISDYKKIENELRASEMNYRELFDNANDFIITVDPEGNITNANRTLLNHLKIDLEKITALNVLDYVNEENKELTFALRDKILSGDIDNSFEVNALGIDGQPVTYEVKASLIISDGKMAGVQCVFSDVTERREAQQKLEKYNTSLVELNKTKDKFFSIIAHDLRNPYSSMIGFSELLLEDLDTLTKDEIRDSLKIIRNSAKNSLNLLENLLAWSRLETGRMPFDPAKVVLTNIVDEVVNVLFSLAYRKKIEISNRVELNVLLFADKNMLNTILNNLVMNAIKFTPIGGQVSISAVPDVSEPDTEKDFIRISVTDTGIGMEADVCTNLFASGKPISRPGTEKEEGTGLGLVLAREMVDRHGGSIMATSEPGKGSVFSFLIPAYNPGKSSS